MRSPIRPAPTMNIFTSVARLRLNMAGRSPALGVLVAVGALALTTLLLYPLSEIAEPVSLGVLYLLAVLLVSTFWGLRLGLATAVAATAAFNFFHIPPTGRFTIADAENWVALVVFLVAAVVASTLSGLARQRAEEAEQRRPRGRPGRGAGAAAARRAGAALGPGAGRQADRRRAADRLRRGRARARRGR